ncbi:MAG: acyl-CoA dehydrogenase family protein [Propionibacteriaceae bacterium]
MSSAVEMAARARRLADEVFFPAAGPIDRSGELPSALLDRLADAGFYGVAAPAAEGGLDTAGLAAAGALIEPVAGGCLSAAFIWIQHHGAVLGVANAADPAVRERWLARLANGNCRAGIALAGVRPGPDQLQVRESPDGWVVNGRVPWVTGWHHIDTVYLAAVDGETVRFLLIDAVESPSLGVTRLDLMAAQASSTVEITFTDHRVPADRLVTTTPLTDWLAANASGSALNGYLALGVAQRCARLLETDAYDSELANAREALATADASSTPAARAAVSLLAHRLATTLVVRTGSAAAISGSDAERLYREAGFLLVFGSRPLIRDELLDRLS